MNNINSFLLSASKDLTRLDQAIAVLWYSENIGSQDGLSIQEIANIQSACGFTKPNVTILKQGLTKSRLVFKKGSLYRINAKFKDSLDDKYLPLIGKPRPNNSPSILPDEIFEGVSRSYLLKLVKQINGSYNMGHYDACAVISRRLMESLIIETFISKGIAESIKEGSGFVMLEKLISRISSAKQINLARNSAKMMSILKNIGDTAAHDRNYITQKVDIDNAAQNIRKIISELLIISGVKQ